MAQRLLTELREGRVCLEKELFNGPDRDTKALGCSFIGSHTVYK